MVSRGLNLVRVEVYTVRSRLALILSDDATNLAVDASLEVRVSRGPRTEVYFCWVNEVTSIGTEERPGDDGANMEFPR